MQLSSAKIILGKVAATLGILQGLAWTFMTLIAIILYYWAPKIDAATTYSRLIETILYYKFIKDDDTSLLETNFIITTSNFNIAMWIYFVLSVLWCSLSFDLLTGMTVAARGYTLWLINIVFSIILIRESITAESVSNNNESLYSTIPRARIAGRPAS
ncbi:hypothetical protein NQ314_007185 [Rhamnusium bicolor]|uniref:Uncharacterized protein n=1 Tax=Rhamnusium bicolor TaxID=1586634 RepID=A0AAV8YTI6_9CUCU|nr:hypothetical protein NQ314_007185 [Rhamnusium bicolor]